VLWSFGAYSQSKKNANLIENYEMQKSRMETALQAGINGSASSNFSDQLLSPYNEPHPGGIQRKTQREGNWGLWIENKKRDALLCSAL